VRNFQVRNRNLKTLYSSVTLSIRIREYDEVECGLREGEGERRAGIRCDFQIQNCLAGLGGTDAYVAYVASALFWG